MGWLDRMLKSAVPFEPESTAEQPVAIVADQRGAPGTRVHHEYFVDDEPVNGRWLWLCRVYAMDGTPHEMTGSEESREQAASAALTWAAATKRILRGQA